MNAIEASDRAVAITTRLSGRYSFPYRVGINFEGAICNALLDGVAPEAIEKLLDDVLNNVVVFTGEDCVYFETE